MDSLLTVVALRCRIFYCTKDQSEKGTSCTQEQKIFLSPVKHTVLLGFFSYPAFFGKAGCVGGYERFPFAIFFSFEGWAGLGETTVKAALDTPYASPLPPDSMGHRKRISIYQSSPPLFLCLQHMVFPFYLVPRRNKKNRKKLFFTFGKKTASHKSGIDPCCRLLRQRQK